MINKDSIVTAYDEHLTLVEWLQKVEKLITENALESVQVNNVSASTYTLTLTFADGSSITSNTFDLSTITQALTLIDAKADTALNNSVANASEITKIKNGTTPLFENITDSHGNKRFVEGNITMNAIEGVTQTYGKWSLSGSHLMIVVAGNIANGTTFNGVLVNSIELPNYIKEKIPSYPGTASVDIKSVNIYSATNTAQAIIVRLRKSNNIISIEEMTSVTLTADRSFRIQFDLLIDDE